MGNWTSYPTHTKLNGNLYERFDTQAHVINITNENVDINILEEFNKLKQEMHITNEKRNNLEIRLAKLESLLHAKIQTLETSLNHSNSRITIITNDLESLLNNDKLLLDKLIEKNIVSTIQENEEDETIDNTSEYPSGIEQYQSVDQQHLDEINL